MNAKIGFDDAVEFVQESTNTIRVRQGRSFDFSLQDFGGDMDLKLGTVENDQVLDVIEDSRTNEHIGARIMAQGRGTTEIQVQKDRAVVFWLTVQVWDDEAVNLVAPAPVIGLD